MRVRVLLGIALALGFLPAGPPSSAAGGVTVTVNLNASRHPVSPLIYGVNPNDISEPDIDPMYPLARWGGNRSSVYSWTADASNTGNDYFFINFPHTHDDVYGTSADGFVGRAKTAGAQAILTVPTIGRTPRDGQIRWSYSLLKYGAQRQTECSFYVEADPVGTALNQPYGPLSWCHSDAGNGDFLGGVRLVTPDPADAYVAAGPSFDTVWLAHLRSKFGAGSVPHVALDNEPMLWADTHSDAHPALPTYDELWQRTHDYATAMKAAQPAIKILGPAEWGWCAYFTSAVDAGGSDGDCTNGPDRAAHGGVPLLQWYMQRNCADALQLGYRPVDTLDIHYYPQEPGLAFSTDESPATAAKRFRSLRGLYDPSYNGAADGSWIPEPTYIIPRMKQWIQSSCPGMGLAITEYNFGEGDESGALAQAEALAIFGREGVDLATRWVAPLPGSRVRDAFRMYLDYDGAGTGVEGDSVSAVSADVTKVGAYVIDGVHTYVLLFNKDTASTSVDVSGLPAGPAALYRFDATHALAPAGSVAASGGHLILTLPAHSATLAVLP
jgi:glycosyl hydrolase family 44